MASTKRIKIRNKCQPLEKANNGSRWWLDSDFGRATSSKDTIEDLETFEYGFKDAPPGSSYTKKDFAAGLAFIYVKCKDIQDGDVTISFDGTDNTVVKLGINEGISVRLDPTAQDRVVMSGESGIEFLTGTT